MGKRADENEIKKFLSGAIKYEGDLKIPGISKSFQISDTADNQILLRNIFSLL